MFSASIGSFEVTIILIAVILIFGVEKIPEIAKNIANGIREFKKTIKDIS